MDQNNDHPKNSQQLKIELLLKEYEIRSAEISEAAQHYRGQVNFIYIYVSGIVAISGLLSSKEDIQNALKQLGAQSGLLNQGFFLFLLSISALIGFYLYANALSSLFLIYLNAVRRAAIEELLNREAKQKLLVWDLKIIKEVYSITFKGEGGWINPHFIVGSWSFLFFLTSNVFLCVLCSIFAKDYLIFFSVIVVSLTLFHIYQWMALHTKGIRRIVTIVRKESRVSLKGWEKLKVAQSMTKSKKFGLLFAFLTIFLGWFPLVVLSLETDSFWPSSIHPFPFMLNMSVLLGDSVLLPIFNYYFFLLYFENKEIIRGKLAEVLSTAVVSLGAALYFQWQLHNSWKSDSFTGFMDLQVGFLSIAGWWHFFFSSIQMAIFIIFLVVWWITCPHSRKLGFKAWMIALGYFSIGVLDLLIKVFSSFAALSINEIFIREWPLGAEVLLAIAVLLFFRRHCGIEEGMEANKTI